MNTNYIQPLLFPELQSNESLNEGYRYQIKSMDDPAFGVSITLNGDEDPESIALEKLGYFVIPESSFS